MNSADNHNAIFTFTQLAGWTCIGGYVFVTGDGVLVELRPSVDNAWHISLIVTPREHRQKGYAAAALKRLLQAADEHAVVVTLNASPSRGSSLKQAQLIKWYTRNGFLKDASSPLMVRRPHKREKTDQHTGKPGMAAKAVQSGH
jgi:GNAT superfamily N-acetyltransferase